MNAQDIGRELESLGTADDVSRQSDELVATWDARSVGVECVEPILRYMEAHPASDFGMPGPLVHLVERFHNRGYEPQLIASISRRPVRHTIWMINRAINGATSKVARSQLVTALVEAREHVLADAELKAQIDHFLSRLGQ